MLARLSSKGQLVIPKVVREALGLPAGTQFHIRLAGGKIFLEPITPSPIAALHGKYSDADFLAELEAEHRWELTHEEAIPRPLRHLAGLIKSSRPKASVDVAQYMTQRGYESLHGQQNS